MGFLSKLWDQAFGWLSSDDEQNQDGAQTGILLTRAATDAPVRAILGRRGKLTGTVVYMRSNDVDNDDVVNDLLHINIVWGEGPGHAIDQTYLDGTPISDPKFSADNGVRWAHVRNFTNGMADYHDPVLLASGWNNNGTDRLDGKICSYVRLEWGGPQQELFNGHPNVTADISGLIVNDLATVKSYPCVNPASQLYEVLVNHIIGKGLTIDLIDKASFVRAANICKTQVETYLGSGIYQDLFTSNCILDTSKSILDNVNDLLRLMRAWLPVVDGKLTLIIEADDPPVDYALIENQNVIEMSPITNSSKSNRYNRVVVTYVDPDSFWSKQDVFYPEKGTVLAADWLDEDNGVRLEKKIKLEGCTNHYEALRFAKAFAGVSRQQLRTRLLCSPGTFRLDVGDIVPVTHSFPKWKGKLFRIEEKERYENGDVSFLIREHQPNLYDWANTGEKPEIPDTGLDYSAPGKPTDLIVKSHYSDSRQVSFEWSGGVRLYDVVVKDAEGLAVVTERLGRKSLNANGLPVGHYKLWVRGLNSLLTPSPWATKTFEITAPTTPTDPGELIEPGVIIITLPDQVRTTPIYEYYYSVNDSFESATYGGKGERIVISGTSDGVVYYVWYRLISAEGPGEWVRFVTGQAQGLGWQQLGNPLTDILDRVTFGGDIDIQIGAIDIRIDDINIDIGDIDTRFIDINTSVDVNAIKAAVDLSNVEAHLETAIGLNLLQSLQQVQAATDNNYLSVDYVNQIDGWQIDINEQLGQVLVEGGIVTADQFKAYQLKIDTHAGTLESLSTWQIETDEALVTFTSKLEQNSQGISFLVEHLSAGDYAEQFNQVAIRIDGIQNSIETKALSVNLQQLAQLDQILGDNLDQHALIDQGIELSLARSELQAITQDNQAYAQKLDEVLTIASGGYAIARNAITAVSSEMGQRATNEQLLKAQMGGIDDAVTAQIYRLDQVVSDADGNATAISVLEGDVNNVTTGLSATYSLANQASLDADGNATAISEMQVKVTKNESDMVTAGLQISATASDVDGLKSEIFLGVDNNGRVTGLHQHGDETQTTIDIVADAIRHLHPDTLEPVQSFNLVKRRAEFHGTIFAENIEGDAPDSQYKKLAGLTITKAAGKIVIASGTIEESKLDRRFILMPFILRAGNYPDNTLAQLSLSLTDDETGGAGGADSQIQYISGDTSTPVLTAWVARNQTFNFEIAVEVHPTSTGDLLIRQNTNLLCNTYAVSNAISFL